MSSLGFLPAAKPPRSMDHKITVGGERGGWVLICLLGKFCEMRGRIGVTLPPWKILRIVFKCEVKSAMLPFVAHIYCPCRRRSIGPLPSCFPSSFRPLGPPRQSSFISLSQDKNSPSIILSLEERQKLPPNGRGGPTYLGAAAVAACRDQKVYFKVG